ncbi:ATP-dependent zinc protease [Curvivirga sp.]|uniref:ATP-dependent zinc protease family protein n=1 Tax=Curvivirga sp. TaxID=2856848 RepID=UPI003B5A0D78
MLKASNYLLLSLAIGLAGCAATTQGTTSQEVETPKIVEKNCPIPAPAPKPEIIETKQCGDLDTLLEEQDVLLIGEAEHVYIFEAGFSGEARIDTGATTSSIGAEAIKRYEKDGEDWVKFDLRDRKTDKVTTIRTKIERIAAIKQHGRDPLERPVVLLTMSLGDQVMKREFTLASRDHYEYPILIGRNVLRNAFYVNVDEKFIHIPVKEMN